MHGLMNVRFIRYY